MTEPVGSLQFASDIPSRLEPPLKEFVGRVGTEKFTLRLKFSRIPSRQIHAVLKGTIHAIPGGSVVEVRCTPLVPSGIILLLSGAIAATFITRSALQGQSWLSLMGLVALALGFLLAWLNRKIVQQEGARALESLEKILHET